MPKTLTAEHRKPAGSNPLCPGAALVVLVLLLALAGIGCDSEEAPPPPPPSQLRAVL